MSFVCSMCKNEYPAVKGHQFVISNVAFCKNCAIALRKKLQEEQLQASLHTPHPPLPIETPKIESHSPQSNSPNFSFGLDTYDRSMSSSPNQHEFEDNGNAFANESQSPSPYLQRGRTNSNGNIYESPQKMPITNPNPMTNPIITNPNPNPNPNPMMSNPMNPLRRQYSDPRTTSPYLANMKTNTPLNNMNNFTNFNNGNFQSQAIPSIPSSGDSSVIGSSQRSVDHLWSELPENPFNDSPPVPRFQSQQQKQNLGLQNLNQGQQILGHHGQTHQAPQTFGQQGSQQKLYQQGQQNLGHQNLNQGQQTLGHHGQIHQGPQNLNQGQLNIGQQGLQNPTPPLSPQVSPLTERSQSYPLPQRPVLSTLLKTSPGKLGAINSSPSLININLHSTNPRPLSTSVHVNPKFVASSNPDKKETEKKEKEEKEQQIRANLENEKNIVNLLELIRDFSSFQNREYIQYTNSEGRYYYFNRITSEVTWEKPKDFHTKMQIVNVLNHYFSIAKNENSLNYLPSGVPMNPPSQPKDAPQINQLQVTNNSVL